MVMVQRFKVQAGRGIDWAALQDLEDQPDTRRHWLKNRLGVEVDLPEPDMTTVVTILTVEGSK